MCLTTQRVADRCFAHTVFAITANLLADGDAQRSDHPGRFRNRDAGDLGAVLQRALALGPRLRSPAVLTVYMIHWNAPEWCTTACAAIARSEPPVSLTVVDNSPPNHFEGARTLPQESNRGFAGGANVALREWLAGEEDFCVIAAHDLTVEPDTLRLMLAAAEAHPRAGILGPRFDAEAVHGPLIDTDGILERYTWISGTCLLLRRECIEEIGQFDESFGSYVEDLDLCYRARDAGWEVCTVVAAHAQGIGTAVGRANARALIRRNHILLGYKRDGVQGLVRALWTTGKYAGLALRQQRWRDAWSYLRGLGWALAALTRSFVPR
jgi:GT2 family glycosyltransferase